MTTSPNTASNLPTDFEGDTAPVVNESPDATDSAAKAEPKVKAAAKAKPVTEAKPGKDVDGIPYCRDHHCRMKRSSGGKRGSATTYYKCPVAGCECTAQIIKTKVESVVPPKPLACPRCTRDKKPVICERSKRHSTAASVVLQCPSCGWKSNSLAVPSLAAQDLRNRSTNKKRAS